MGLRLFPSPETPKTARSEPPAVGLEEKGLIGHLLQQNHDRLPQKAGFPQAKINEIHGAWGDTKNQAPASTMTRLDPLDIREVGWGDFSLSTSGPEQHGPPLLHNSSQARERLTCPIMPLFSAASF